MARARQLADFVVPCLGKALAAQGFARSDIVVSWPEIVGDRLAGYSRPLKIEWPRGRDGRERDEPGSRARDPATLVVRVVGAFALEMQHLAPVVIDRINAYYGWRCVGRLVLKQGPLPRPAPTRMQPRAASDAERRRVSDRTAGIAADDLRAALDRLGVAVVAAEPTANRRGEA